MFFKASEGTRVVVLDSKRAGAVLEVRYQGYLKPYVVLFDDGTKGFVSACNLAVESDPDLEPLGPAIC